LQISGTHPVTACIHGIGSDSAIFDILGLKVANKNTLRIDFSTSLIYARRIIKDIKKSNYSIKLDALSSQWREIFVPPELWVMIFSKVSMNTLHHILKAINDCEEPSVLRSIIQRNEVLVGAAVVLWGDSQPPPPPEDLSILDYYMLLASSGCNKCGNTRTRKLYMAYLGRYCAECLEEETCTVSIALSSWPTWMLTIVDCCSRRADARHCSSVVV
jgi:hypothetical protein